VDVISVLTTKGRIAIQLRVYNAQSEPVNLRPQDSAIAFGDAPQPPGPWTTAEGLELFTLPGQAVIPGEWHGVASRMLWRE
jgi:hypothetical protein